MSKAPGRSNDAARGRQAEPRAEPAAFNPMDTVRVARILGSARGHLVAGSHVRPPRVGDIGIVVGLAPGDHGARRYLLEAVGEDGALVWQAAFNARELTHADSQIEDRRRSNAPEPD